MEELIQIGAVTGTHGVRGEVKAFPTTDDPARYKELKQVIVTSKKGQEILEIAGVKFFKQMVILKFRGIDDMDAAQAYKGAKLYVERGQAVPLEADEYYYADLIGLSAVSDTGEPLGIVSDILQTGANDVYVIRSESGQELLVPAIKDCVKEVRLERKEIILHLLPGLREINARKQEKQGN